MTCRMSRAHCGNMHGCRHESVGEGGVVYVSIACTVERDSIAGVSLWWLRFHSRIYGIATIGAIENSRLGCQTVSSVPLSSMPLLAMAYHNLDCPAPVCALCSCDQCLCVPRPDAKSHLTLCLVQRFCVNCLCLELFCVQGHFCFQLSCVQCLRIQRFSAQGLCARRICMQGICVQYLSVQCFFCPRPSCAKSLEFNVSVCNAF